MILGLFVPTGGLEAFLVAGDTHVGAVPLFPGIQVLNRQLTTYTLFPYSPTQPLVAGPPLIPRYSGSAIIIHDSANTNRVLRFGGSDGPTFTLHAPLSAVEEWDPINQVWVAKAPLLQARLFQNAVILPDRTVFVVGGSTHDYHNVGPPIVPFSQPEIYDPGTGPAPLSGTSCFAAAESTPRVYHSVACLLPDGRVLACGGQDVVNQPPSKDTGAVFTPAYHLSGPTPRIMSAPSITGYGPHTFTMTVRWTTPSLPAQYRVVLIKPGSVTHHFDNEQRYIELQVVGAVQQGSNWVLTVASPTNATLVPGGYYMLWAVEANVAGSGRWIPSRSVTVHVP